MLRRTLTQVGDPTRSTPDSSRLRAVLDYQQELEEKGIPEFNWSVQQDLPLDDPHNRPGLYLVRNLHEKKVALVQLCRPAGANRLCFQAPFQVHQYSFLGELIDSWQAVGVCLQHEEPQAVI